MTVDQAGPTVRDPVHMSADPDSLTTPATPAGQTAGEVLGVTAIGALTAGWLTMSWQLMGKPFIDAVGETVGAVSVILLAVSVLGSVHAQR
jgi:hypothetical protein